MLRRERRCREKTILHSGKRGDRPLRPALRVSLLFLHIVRFALRLPLPARYVVVELVGEVLGPRLRYVDGRIGKYHVRLDLRDQLQRQVFFGLYEPAESELVHSYLRKGDVFIDVGANIGYYSLIASEAVGQETRVHAIEPVPANAQALRETIALNGITNIEVRQVAAGSHRGVTELHIAAEPVGNSAWASGVPSALRTGTIVVPTISIDEYAETEAISSVRLVKIDVEGFEPEVLAGMKSILSRYDAPAILCEVNPFLLDRRGMDSRRITLTLADHHYLCIHPNGRKGRFLDAGEPIGRMTNIFCTKMPAEQLQEGIALNREASPCS